MRDNSRIKLKPFWLIVLFYLFQTGSAFAEDYVEWVGANSGVNWSAAQIKAEGAGVGPENARPAQARLMACRAAVVDGQRNLLESIQGVRVQGDTVVENMMLTSDTIKTSVSGLLQGALVTKRSPQDDGSCIVEVSAPLSGKFTTTVYEEIMADESGAEDQARNLLPSIIDTALALLVPEAVANQSMPWQAALDKVSERISALEKLLSDHPAVVAAGDAKPTGLILDARGSNFVPSMSPKIRKVRANVIYPTREHQIERRERGQLVSLFTRDLDTARRHPIVGERPVVLKALRTWGDTRTEIVLGAESSERLEKLVGEGFLSDSGVIIVL